MNVSDLAALRCTTLAFRQTPESAAPRRRNAADVAAAGVKERTAIAIVKSTSNSSHSDNLLKDNNHAPPSQIARPPYNIPTALYAISISISISASQLYQRAALLRDGSPFQAQLSRDTKSASALINRSCLRSYGDIHAHLLQM